MPLSVHEGGANPGGGVITSHSHLLPPSHTVAPNPPPQLEGMCERERERSSFHGKVIPLILWGGGWHLKKTENNLSFSGKKINNVTLTFLESGGCHLVKKNFRLALLVPRGYAGGLAENTSSVSPACRKRRLNGAPLYSLSR